MDYISQFIPYSMPSIVLAEQAVIVHFLVLISPTFSEFII